MLLPLTAIAAKELKPEELRAVSALDLVWKGNAGDLAFSMIHGRPVVRDGRLLTMDEGAVMRTAAAAARKIWEIGEKRGILPARPMQG